MFLQLSLRKRHILWGDNIPWLLCEREDNNDVCLCTSVRGASYFLVRLSGKCDIFIYMSLWVWEGEDRVCPISI